ncbi:MAG: DUF4157 domain-containing protein [Lacibacter sp.]
MSKTIYRRMRRRTASHEAANTNKESRLEQSFFGEASHETFFQPSPAIQRKCEKCEEEDKKVQRQKDKKEEDKKLQRATDKKEEEKLQKKESANSPGSSVGVNNYVASLSGKGQSLSADANQYFSSRMGYDFSDVKIHTDNEAAQSANEVNAKAYTVGKHIVFNEGYYNTGSTEGKRLMAHELVHVLQQQSQVVARDLKEKTEKEFSIKITKGDKDWKDDEVQLVMSALKRLNKKEATVVVGYEFVRWSNAAERMKKDKTYIPPEKTTNENCLHEQNFKKGINRITAYDSCFGDPEAVNETEYGLSPGEFRLLHEIGHLMQAAEFRMAFLEFEKQRGTKREEASEKAKDVKDKSQQKFDELTKGKEPMESSDPSNVEQFAESFAVYKASPGELKKKNLKLFNWFQSNGHLKNIK